MAVPDPDYGDLHVSVLDFNTSLPYVDTQTGLVSDDMPIEGVTFSAKMYEAKKTDVNVATVTLPSLMQRPALRSLIQAIKAGAGGGLEGARVEIRNFQPYGGPPVFAGDIPVEGVHEQDGKVSFDVHDSMGRGKRQHVKRMEEFNAPVNTAYTRGMGYWKDLGQNAYNTGLQPAGYTYLFSGTSGTVTFDAVLGLRVNATADTTWNYAAGAPATNIDMHVQADGGDGSKAFTLNVGDTFLIEMDANVQSDMHMPTYGYAMHVGGLLGITNIAGGSVVGMTWDYWANNGLLGQVIQSGLSAFALPTGVNSLISNQPTFVDRLINHRYSTLIKVVDSTHVTISAARDGLVYATAYNVPFTSTGSWAPFFNARNNYGPGNELRVTSFRARKLVPYVNRAARFNPQTSDAVYFIPNNEDVKSFMDFFTEKDNAEYRLIYSTAPALDQLELDQAGTLGATAPLPYRFEEGVNLAAPPRRNPRATAHANDIIRVGSGTVEGQPEAESYSAAEAGDPLLGISPIYPVFEKLTNDDRISLPSLAQALANFELKRALDTTPSVTVQYVESVDTAFKWREGDSVYLKTTSLLNNLEQNMRIAEIKYKSGSGEREITLGKLENDPIMLRQMHLNMVQQWLYEQSGTGYGTVFPYPSVPWSFLTNTGGVQVSPDYAPIFDQFTVNTQIVSASLHWVMSSLGANTVQANLNGAILQTTSSTADSGIIPCTQVFLNPGTPFALHFETTITTGSTPPVIASAYLVLRARV